MFCRTCQGIPNNFPLFQSGFRPFIIEPSFFSSPNNSSSYFLTSKSAPFKIIKGPLSLLEFLCIFLAINSFPEPVGPLIKTLLSEVESFSICSRIFWMFWLEPTNSKEWNSWVWRFLFSVIKLKFSTALFTKLRSLSWSKGFWINSNAPDLRAVSYTHLRAHET